MKPHRPVEQTEKAASPAQQFDRIAFLYDELMAGVPYKEWVRYIMDILQEFGHLPQTILDLCCGTGRVSVLLARKGFGVSGVDISDGMIRIAEHRGQSEKVDIDFHVQDASKLRLGRKFGLVVSLFDSLNYILDATALQQTFYRVFEHMEEGALFIFDMNTELALAEGFFDQTNMVHGPATVNYNWRSSYDSNTRICRVQMDFIYHGQDGDEQVEVIHYQRAYSIQEVKEMLASAGLDVLATYDSYTFDPINRRTDRVFFVARKPFAEK